MADSEERRYQLHRKLEEVFGPQEAGTLMEHLPPWRWDEVATKGDMAALKGDVAVLKADVAELKGDVVVLKADVAELKGDVVVLKADVAELKADIGTLRSDMQTFAGVNQAQHEALEHKFIGHLEREMRKQTWRLVTAMAAVGGLIVAGVHL